jgi:hypothetical protein
MTEAEAIQAILAQWEDVWDTLHPHEDPEWVPYTYDNEAFTTDALGDLGSWVRVTIQMSTRQQTTQGGPPYRKFDNKGRIFVTIFTPIDAGRALRARLADDVRTALEGQRLGDLLLYDGVTRGEDWFGTGPAREGGIWSMSTVVIEFRFTETR